MTLEEIKALDQKYYMNTYGERLPVCFTHGNGCTLYDLNGKAYTDFFAGIAVNVLGYNHPSFVKTLCNQLQKITHCSNLYYIEQQAKLAETLVNHTCFDRAFFCNTGAEANEGAIKLARKYFYEKGEDRYEIITANQSFHGRTLATLAATGQDKYRKPYHPLTPSFISVDYNDFNALQSALTDKTCAVMLELVQGEGGVYPANKNYIASVASLCQEKGILLIIDEVQTGIGRTGTLFAYEQYGIQPDILTAAKALGNGIPIGAVLAKENVAAAFHPGDHGTTFGGNPLACAAGLSVLEELLEQGVLKESVSIGLYLRNALEDLQQKHPSSILAVRGLGLLLGVQLSSNPDAAQIVKQMLEAGFVLGTAAGNTLRLAPPLIISKQEIDQMISALHQILA